MREHLDAGDLYAYIRMLRSVDNRVFLVLEGPSDAHYLNGHIDASDCTTIAGYGKFSVLAAFEVMTARDLRACLGLIDRDFDDLSADGQAESMATPPNVFVTDLYDLECDLMLRAGVLGSLVESTGNAEKCDRLIVANGGVPLDRILIRSAALIGLVRWCSIVSDFNLRLSEFPVVRILEWPAHLNRSDVVDLAIRRTNRDDISIDMVMSVLPTSYPIDEERICSGHDLVRVTAASSEWWAGRSIGYERIVTLVSRLIPCDRLQGLTWVKQIEAWAEDNSRRIWNCQV